MGEANSSLRSWFALSAGSLWRASVAMELEGSDGHDVIHDSISGLQIREMSRRGYLSLIPLDLHPAGGFVLIGNSRQVTPLSHTISEYLAEFPLMSSQEAFGQGGGPAL
ncbi:hypothetical protein ABZY09_22325 [Streptomyces sp. NPDC002928]|uniref:hypothetical protein n=1 Tax=Streptomyces sp. NPDC002928 TaxID=3154440 RepID=UPI0033AE19DB